MSLERSFDTVEITGGKQTIARCQVIKIWRGEQPDGISSASLTFLASSVGDHKTQWEELLTSFEAGVVAKRDLVTLNRRRQVDGPPLRIKFESHEGLNLNHEALDQC
jgi:hypothetical protein